MPERLSAACDEIDLLLVRRGAGERARFGSRLICEEIVLNAFEHGGARFVDIDADVGADPPRLTIEDDGRSFDPTAARPAAEPASAVEISPRGRGLRLIRHFATRLDYGRDAGVNRLTVTLAE